MTYSDRTHWAIKRFDKYLGRTMWVILGVYIFVWIHPSPDVVKAIMILVATTMLGVRIGSYITSWLIVKAEAMRDAIKYQ